MLSGCVVRTPHYVPPMLAMRSEADRRLEELGLRYGLTATAERQVATLLGHLASDDLAPTSVRDPRQAVDVHIADALVALDVAAVRAAQRVADIGSGAGFPGLPIAAALRLCQVYLVESQARKCLYLESAIAQSGIDNAHVVRARVEEWSAGADAHDVVFARAIAPQPVVLEYAAPLLRPGGVVVDWRGHRNADDEQAALRAANELGMELTSIRRVQPFSRAEGRHLHLFTKASETPGRFPRRSGMARKRPLGT